MTDLRFRIRAHASRLAEVRRLIRHWLSAAGADEVDDVVLAVDEAVANAIEHGAANAPHSHVDVVARADADWISVEVTDEGRWQPRPLDDTRGRGLALIGALMDRVRVDATDHGTRLLMERRRQVGT